jgi:hypothetical protein
MSIATCADIRALYAEDMKNVARAKALRTRINVLTEELSTCTTVAMRRSVTESIIDAERQLTELG